MSEEKPEWYKFQEEIKEHFLSIGADAETNVTMQGVRTSHDIDVVVKTKFLGDELLWLVEAKCWNSKITKDKVLTFHSIVEQIGADSGFIISKKGFQKGAYEAANNTCIRLKTFEELKIDTSDYVEDKILKSYRDRIARIDDRYWAHKKAIRIEYGLRHEVPSMNWLFVGQELLTTAEYALLEASAKNYPIDLTMHMTERKGKLVVNSFQQLINWLNLNLNHFDEKLLVAEWAMSKDGKYNPDNVLTPIGEMTSGRRTALIMQEAEKIKKITRSN